MRRLNDLVGKQFGRLVVSARHFRTGRRVFWWCRCECGYTKSIEAGHLTSGRTRSCGCLRREKTRALFTIHGQTESKEYQAWCRAKNRCVSPDNHKFSYYGGRGIKMCADWVNDFQAFRAHIGPCPSVDHSLDRIDNERGYEPGNVRWATKQEQRRNQRPRNSHMVIAIVQSFGIIIVGRQESQNFT